MADWFNKAGCWVSAKVSGLAAHPFAQAGLLLVCGVWLARGLEVDTLTLALSILAITLTQMVLNMQMSREAEAHRRDLALHAKLDELVLSMQGARDELAGIEEREEDEIEALRHRAGGTGANEAEVVVLEPAATSERRARRGTARKVASAGR